MARFSRRDFLKTVSTAGAASLALAGTPARGAPAPAAPAVPPRAGRSVMGLRAPKLDLVRCAVIGLGARGGGTLRELLALEGCEVRAVCDPHAPSLKRALDNVAKAKKPAPAAFGNGPEDYKRLLARDDLDAVFICTPWRDHTPMALATMRAGKHAFIEVPAAITVAECWQLVDTAEATQRHCMMLENVNYGREELMVLRMCRAGVFGELLHGEASYLHDLRSQSKQVTHGTGSWRIPEHEKRDGNLYTTHGLGPVAQYMNINRGDRFARIVSLSSPSLGLPDYAEKNFPAGHPRRTANSVCGDINTSIIKTARGRTILLQHNTTSPRPYSRHNLIQGTRGLYSGFPDRVYIEGRSPKDHTWEDSAEALAKYRAEFEHPLWTKVADVAKNLGETARGHGGMDFVMRYRIIQCLREGLPLDQDVYDAAAWSVVGPLSEQSVAQGGMPAEIPDFTRGAWETAQPLGIVS